MVQMVTELNAINARYRNGPETYQAGVFQDNCVHLPHNALAATDFLGRLADDSFLLFAIFDFPVPKNEFVNVMRRSNDVPLDNLVSLYRDPAARHDLLQYGRLPTEPGAICVFPTVWRNNDVYDTNLDLIFFDEAIFGRYRHRFDRIFSESRYYDLDANRSYFESMYQRIEADRKPVDWWLVRLGPAPASKRRDFRRFYAQFYHYVRTQRAQLDDARPNALAWTAPTAQQAQDVVTVCHASPLAAFCPLTARKR